MWGNVEDIIIGEVNLFKHEKIILTELLKYNLHKVAYTQFLVLLKKQSTMRSSSEP